jgi:glycosyltransferase involved in cell wall biosynthesis
MRVLFLTAGIEPRPDGLPASGGAVIINRLAQSLATQAVEVLTLNPHHLAAAPELLAQTLTRFHPHVAHLFQYEAWPPVSLSPLFAQPAVPVVATALDYGWFCPRTTLMTGRGSLCLAPASHAQCQACSRQGRHPAVALARLLALLIPSPCRSWPGLGSLLRDRLTRQTRLARTFTDWPWYLHAIARWIAPSQAMAHWLQAAGVDPQHIACVPYGLAPPSNRPPKSPALPVVFTYAGRGIFEKGLHLVVDAFVRLARSLPTVRLRLFGVSPLHPSRYARRCLRQLRPVQEHVDYATYDASDPASLAQTHVAITAMIVPSLWYDNLPSTVVESLAYGTPVIASRHSSAAEPIRDGENGLLFDAFLHADLGSKMRLFATNEPLRRRLLRRTAYPHSPALEARSIKQLYEQLA